MKVGAKDHIKVKRLKRALGVPLYQAVGILETLYQVCASSADDGGIGRYCNSDIALELEWDGDPDTLIQGLIETGLVDEHEVHRLMVHDWLEHAPEFIKDRLRKRQSNSDTSRNSGGNSDKARNSTGDSVSTIPNHTNANQTKPNHASGRRRNRNGALASVVVDDLRDAGRVLRWFARAYPDRQSQDGQLFVLAAAQAALRGKDPPALFVHIVSSDSRSSVRDGDLDLASKMLEQQRNRGAPESNDLLADLAEALATTDEP